MSGRPHRAYWVLTVLLYGRHPWLQRAPGGWVSVNPTAASVGMHMRVGRLRAALLRLRGLGLITELRCYRGRWDIQISPPITGTDTKA
jgi:hypothetical protein